MLGWGEAAPWFIASELNGSSAFAFDTIGGRHVMMLFFGTAAREESRQALATVDAHRALFDDQSCCFFGVTIDPTDAEQQRIAQQLPGIHFFLDYQRRLSALFGVADGDRYRPHWLLLDPMLRMIGSYPMQQSEQAIAALKEALAPPPAEPWAPVLQVPNVLEPMLCAELIRRYENNGGEPSGFMRDVDGKTTLLLDPSFKQRRDWTIDDDELVQTILGRLNRRMTMPIQRAFQFTPTRIERHMVACYEAGAGHFRAHRDNTTQGTAHRRFAVTINLNQEYDGGDLRFPEYGERTYRAPVGGAIVFSCSLLHEARPVTRGRRFAYLPFLYDEEAAKIRESNNANLGDGVSAYRMSGAKDDSQAA